MNQAQKHFHRFFILVELMDLQRTTFQADLKQAYKFRFNNLNAALQSFRKEFTRQINFLAQTQYEDLGALTWELLDEFDKASDKATFLALCRAYNAGQVKISEESEKELAA